MRVKCTSYIYTRKKKNFFFFSCTSTLSLHFPSTINKYTYIFVYIHHVYLRQVEFWGHTSRVHRGEMYLAQTAVKSFARIKIATLFTTHTFTIPSSSPSQPLVYHIYFIHPLLILHIRPIYYDDEYQHNV